MIGTLSRPLPRRQIGRLLLVDLVVILILVGFPVRTNWDNYAAARKALRDQEVAQSSFTLRVARAQQARHRVPVMIGEIRAGSDLLSRRRRKLRAVFETADIQEDIRDLVRRRRLTYLGMRPQEPTLQEAYQVRSFSLDVQGTFSNLLRFLYELRNMDSMIFVERVRIEQAAASGIRGAPGASSQSTGNLHMRAELRTVLVEQEISVDAISEVLADSTWARDVPGAPAAPAPGVLPDTSGVGK